MTEILVMRYLQKELCHLNVRENSHKLPEESWVSGKKRFWNFKYHQNSQIYGAEQLADLEKSVNFIPERFNKFEKEIR